jgi:hypothetical protein
LLAADQSIRSRSSQQPAPRVKCMSVCVCGVAHAQRSQAKRARNLARSHRRRTAAAVNKRTPVLMLETNKISIIMATLLINRSRPFRENTFRGLGTHNKCVQRRRYYNCVGQCIFIYNGERRASERVLEKNKYKSSTLGACVWYVKDKKANEHR